MSRPILLDTCAAIWLAEGKLGREGLEQLSKVAPGSGGVLVSPITAWEIGLLVSRGRLVLSLAPDAWFRKLISVGVGSAELSPEILIASSFLPKADLRDPADRILAATARALNLRLMTRDRPLLDFASAGHMQAIAC